MNESKPEIALRIIKKGSTITAFPDATVHAPVMAQDVMNLAWKWLDTLEMPVRREGARFEFVTDETLAYIEALEGLLENLQADPDTPDEVLEQIERILK
jgi:hypothetical protein